MSLQCGLVGLPNVGKSTLFNALTNAKIAAENYPFCTIEPNVGVVGVPDLRLDALAQIVKPERVVPTTMEFVDIAGLVKGASKGEGLGNAFLTHIRNTDAICQMVRCFENSDIIHVDGKVDPINDVEIIQTELILADMDTLEKAKLRLGKLAKSGNKEAIEQMNCIEGVLVHLGKGNLARTFGADIALLESLHLLTAKPMMYVANMDESLQSPHLTRLQEYAKQHDSIVVPICASIEAELWSLAADERAEFLQEMGLTEPGLNRVIRAGYDLLNLETYFTAGVKEVRAWTIKVGSTAPKAAAAIHTDFERGFIRAEIISYDDFIKFKGEAGAKEAGKWRLEGKEYIVKDGDVIHFRFNV